MRLVSPKEDLAGALAVAGRIASAKSTIQILSHVLIRADEGRCEIAATDMELSLRVPLAATVEEPGGVVLPRLAGDIVRTMAAGGNYGTSVVANEFYNQSFRYNEKGIGATLAVVLFILVIPLVVYNVPQMRKVEEIR